MPSSGGKDNMRFRIKTMCQNCCVTLAILMVCIFVYHEFSQNFETESQTQKRGTEKLKSLLLPPSRLERAPRSLNGDYEINNIENEIIHPKLNRISESTTQKNVPLLLDDIFISVKTTKRFHKTRLDVIYKTWFKLAKQQTYIYTDYDDPEFQRKTGGHLVNTNCSSSHNRRALCCKMAKEFDGFLESKKKWWCHFDDDNYVNIPALVKTLEVYDPMLDWYIGKPSINAPLEILSKDNVSKISFWFATGGAGFCISKSLALKMMPIAGGGKFISVGEKIRLPDDVTMGYIIEHLLKKKLTVVQQFHSHLEPMRFLKPADYSDQISFSYSKYTNEMNVLQISSKPNDPTRFLSLHCFLFNNSEDYCIQR